MTSRRHLRLGVTERAEGVLATAESIFNVQRAQVLPFEGQTSARSASPREDFVPLKDVTLHIVDGAGGEPTILAIHGSAGMAPTVGVLAAACAQVPAA